ncbi:uncharacterized protein BDZ99DRAFT_422483 [Mytilinidion resinicola]|uniref:Uncharacterized protein n=1 Tax=Mytilinidion resinicola TaxID=574789 RepID=A0A6A6YGQ0_9PEZI|nr:uncharacterized protein BDZ99DRAFT_422483 [Mytilinidion resinicola]KAF2807077.1 hypothetical protein BDZ99DRAFT_422483 [Mytilinidion resinicola]
MSQKGGTYRPSDANVATQSRSRSPTRSHEDKKTKDGESTADEKNESDAVALRSDSSTQAQGQDDGKTDGQEWAVVNKPQDEPNTLSGGGVSSHFDLQLGWGRYKFTLFSWDLNVKKEHTHRDGET